MDHQTDCFIHETSVIDDGVTIGSGTTIWHFCHLQNGARIGRSCQLGQHVYIGRGVSLGNGVKIQNNVSVYTGVVLEDDVFCGASVVFTNMLTPRAADPRSEDQQYLPTLVKQGATIGANATIVCGNTIGQYAMIGAGSVVTSDVEPYALVYGNPARQHGWTCQCGVVLHFHGPLASCRECGKNYRQTVSAKIQYLGETAKGHAA